jgi:5'-deoxy-5'-methylthioadenosine phosphorylase
MKYLGLIGGTGLGQWGGLEHDIRGETPFGSTSAPITTHEIGDTCLMFIPRHGRSHTIPPHRVNYRANLWALKDANARHVLAVNAVGGITGGYTPGTLAIPSQLIDYTWGRTQSFWDDDKAAQQHVEFANPFEGRLRELVLQVGWDMGIRMINGGCIGVTQGPRLETAAEIQRMNTDGCDMVGMTSMPEAALARELGLDYASISVVANAAAGIGDNAITVEAIKATLAVSMDEVRTLIGGICERF